MKCDNCNSEMRIGTEQVGVDSNNLPIFNRYAYCDHCMIKINLDKVPKITGDSILSIISIILSGIPMIIPFPHIISVPMIFIGFIMALIDIGINNKQKKHAGSVFAIIFSIITFIVLGVFKWD